ncbi:MAG: hypothetical protein OEY59_05560 [Deltaproteobacteria bacterium]|nr:hypothetical protein [Deltaproteobacteria bacterium]
MKNKLVVSSNVSNKEDKRIIKLCFDSKSISKIEPGLKMLFAQNDAPVFVTVAENTMDGYYSNFDD